jgi:hypothetical protein
MKKFIHVLTALLLSAACFAQSGKNAEILVLGTYHMANPGHDVFNMKADDVLAPKRQQEIAELMEVLKRFQPTKIAIEVDVTSEKTPKQYADYLAGKYTLSRNEIDQIGYRLAKELGHKTVYPVDVDGEFPLQRVINFAKANGKNDQLEASMAEIGKQVKAQNEFMLSHSVLEMLLYMNSDAMAKKGVATYFDYMPYGEPYEYAGPDLLAAWYQRNIRIYHNIRMLIDSPNERILVIYGAGHLGWLQQDVSNDSAVTLRKLSEFTAANK